MAHAGHSHVHCANPMAIRTAGGAEMAPAYEEICEELGSPVDAAKLEALRTANQQRLEKLDATVKDAEENLGDVEVREARAAKADYLCKIGEAS